MHNIGLFGNAGLVSKEIQKILAHDDNVRIVFRQNSKRKKGNLANCDLAIVATHEEQSLEIVPEVLKQGVRVIDTSGAFRLKNLEDYKKYYGLAHPYPDLLQEAVYGLPALYAEEIKTARLVTNPGCYPTGAILALKPLEDMLQGTAIIDSTSGISGARKDFWKFIGDFAWRAFAYYTRKDAESITNERTYKNRKHIPEIECYSGFKILFTPVVIESVFRGINMNIKVELSDKLKGMPDEEAAQEIASKIQQFYKPDDLVTAVANQIGKYGTGNVNHTHKIIINVEVVDGFAKINSLIDNLGKGAASQAVENMHIMLGYPRLYKIGETYRTN